MLGDQVDYGTAASWQPQASGIITDGRTIIQELLELRQVETHKQGYQADSSMDDDSSEGSFTSTTGHEDHNSRLLCSPVQPSPAQHQQ
jgi:hypothetical protein